MNFPRKLFRGPVEHNLFDRRTRCSLKKRSNAFVFNTNNKIRRMLLIRLLNNYTKKNKRGKVTKK